MVPHQPVPVRLRRLSLLALVACGGGAAPPEDLEGPDADGDGLPDTLELRLGTDPKLRDSDDDGKTDGVEHLTLKTDPRRKDTDGDGWADGYEVKVGTDPLVADPGGQPPEPTQERSSPPEPPDGRSAEAPVTRALPQPLLPTTGEAPPAAWQCPRGRVTITECFIPIPGGRFKMGAQASDPAAPNYDPAARPDEGPVHEIELSPYWLLVGELSASVYGRCVDDHWCDASAVSGARPWDTTTTDPRDQLPINSITWDGAQRACAWLGGRLPTEAEWEFAARGTDGRIWPWGNAPQEARPDVLRDPTATQAPGPWPVPADRTQSPWGAVGLAGNVWEWVADGYEATWYGRSPLRDPVAPPTRDRHVQRGGGWTSMAPGDLRAAQRGSMPPGEQSMDVGFRCVWTGREGG